MAYHPDVKSPTWLLAFRSDKYSQTGEDGVVAKILELLPETDRWCVEFGAWDGEWLSNTRRLIEEDGYSAVLIEGNASKFADLRARHVGLSTVTPVSAYVGWHAHDGLDSILKRLPVPTDFDFLSIDIDGNDYHVWKAVADYRPKVVCVEFNPTIPTEVEFIQRADPDTTIGSSLRSLLALGKEKGYEAVAVLDFNVIFVERKYFPRFEIGDNSAETMRASSEPVTYLFTGYDGSVHLAGKRELPWHGLPMRESRLQMLPRPLRRYPGNYNRMEKALFAAYLLLKTPGAFRREFSRRFRKARPIGRSTHG